MNDHATPLLRAFTARPLAMERRALLATLADLSGLGELAAETFARAAAGLGEPVADYALDSGVAIIPITGMILRDPPALWSMFLNVTDVDVIAASLEAAVADPAVKSILLEVDSSGGSIDGVDDTARAVSAADARKPVRAAVTGRAASAAYWIPSGAREISATRTAEVGSIGVYSVLDDWSARYELEGVKTHVISSGPYKGTGVIGAPITDEQLEPIQENINDLARIFVEAVAKGRSPALDVAGVEALATGRVWVAEKAKKRGLIDRVESFAETLAAAKAGRGISG